MVKLVLDFDENGFREKGTLYKAEEVVATFLDELTDDHWFVIGYVEGYLRASGAEDCRFTGVNVELVENYPEGSDAIYNEQEDSAT